jgi:hypothetical protein
LAPVQVQFHGPEPETREAVPVLHKLVGVELKSWPLSAPHWPFTIVSVEHCAVVLFAPLQVHVHEVVCVTKFETVAPLLHRLASLFDRFASMALLSEPH